MTTINAKYLTKLYKKEYALKDCSLDVKNGEFLVIMGQSGCGKTTLLKILAGVEKATSGELYMDGVIADSIPLKDRDISLVFQEYVLYPNMTVYENVAVALEGKMDSQQIYNRVMPVLCKLGLDCAMNQRPRTLSGGQQQRVALAKAIVKQSRLILLDEPMSNVSPLQRVEYCQLLLQLKRQLPETTFVYVTHNASEALTLADRIAVMKDGRVEYCCDRKNFLYNFANADALEVFNGSVNKVSGTWHNGFVCDEQVSVSQRVLDTCRATDGQQLVALSNKMDNGSYYLFDRDGRAVSGAVNEVFVSARLDGNTLHVGSQDIVFDEQFCSRLLKKHGDVTMQFRADKLSKVSLPGSFRLLLDVVYNDGETLGVSWQGTTFYMLRRTNLKVGEQIYMYALTEDVNLFDGQRITAHYPIDHCSVPVKVADYGKRIVKMFGNKYTVSSDVVGKTRALLPVDSLRLANKSDKNTIKVREVLDEDVLGKQKIVYCIVDGADGYVGVLTKSDNLCLEQNIRLCVIPEKVTLE